MKDDVFPIPPVGYEYFDMKVVAQIEDDDGKGGVDDDKGDTD